MKKARAFTLIELLVTMAIVALLAALATPGLQRAMEKARSAACVGNLRALGTAVNLYIGEHEGKLPYINNPARPVYTEPDDIPDGEKAQTMLEAFGPYGLAERTLRCPADALQENYFAKEGTSYEWRPIIDGEPAISPTVYTRRGAITLRSSSRIRIVIDTDTVHFGGQNALFADGRVQMK